MPNGRVGTTTSSPGATTAGSSVIHRSSSPGRGAPKPPLGATSQTISMPSLERVYSRSPDGSIIAVPTMPPAPVRTSFSDHRPVAASMSHSTIAPSAPTVTPHVPSGATSRSITAPGSASNCCRIRPSVSYSVTVPSLPRRAAPVGSARNSKNVAGSSVGASSGDLPTGLQVGERDGPARNVDQHGGRAVVGQLRLEVVQAGRARSPARRSPARSPSTRSTSITRHVVRVSPSVPATSSRARRPSGSTTAPIGSPPTSAPPSTSRTAPSASTVRTHGPDSPVPAASSSGVGRRRGGGAPARPALVRARGRGAAGPPSRRAS